MDIRNYIKMVKERNGIEDSVIYPGQQLVVFEVIEWGEKMDSFYDLLVDRKSLLKEPNDIRLFYIILNKDYKWDYRYADTTTIYFKIEDGQVIGGVYEDTYLLWCCLLFFYPSGYPILNPSSISLPPLNAVASPNLQDYPALPVLSSES